ncbi:MAG TPA: hypothetical protein VER96_27745 [Polyangiaceae bacterium]|nr:hypothetical protein [Polyangiaceae bacterium]
MKHTALLLTLLASIPLGGCAMNAADADGSSEEQSSSAKEPLLWYVSNPAPTVIDFDRDPAGAAIADGTTVDATYNSLGVTLTCIVCGSNPHAFARAPGRAGNGVSLFASPTIPLYDSRNGAVRVEFTTPRSWVSIDALAVLPPEWAGTPQARPWLEAYDAAGNKIGSAVYYPAYGTTGWGTWQTLRFDDPNASIKFVRISSQHYNNSPSVYGAFDNLTFNTDPYWIDVKPIPIPKPPIVFRPTVLQPAP